MPVLIFLFVFTLILVFFKIFFSFTWIGLIFSIIILLLLRSIISFYDNKRLSYLKKIGLNLQSKPENRDDMSLKDLIVSLPAILVLVTSPFWDKNNFCNEFANGYSSCLDNVIGYISLPIIIPIVAGLNIIILLGLIIFYIWIWSKI